MRSSYTYNMYVYTGRGDGSMHQEHFHVVSMRLMTGLLDKSCVLYSYNFYTTVPLADEYCIKKTFPCGTVRTNHKHFPKSAIGAKQKRAYCWL